MSFSSDRKDVERFFNLTGASNIHCSFCFPHIFLTMSVFLTGCCMFRYSALIVGICYLYILVYLVRIHILSHFTSLFYLLWHNSVMLSVEGYIPQSQVLVSDCPFSISPVKYPDPFNPVRTQCTLCFRMGPAGNWLPFYWMSNLAHFSSKIQKLLLVYA